MKKIKKFTFLLFYITTSLHSVEFVLFTEPKTGTHLLSGLLQELTGKKIYWPKKEMGEKLEKLQTLVENPDYIIFSENYYPWKKETLEKIWHNCSHNNLFLHLHPPYLPNIEKFLSDRECINFFIRRDPRDTIVSLLNHYKYIDFIDKTVEQIPSDEERLLYMIKNRLRKKVLNFMGWEKSPVCCALDFAKLMGSHGGAYSDEEALGEMQKIAKALQLDVSDDYLNTVYHKRFGRSWNFFKGKVGSWKDYFTQAHKKATKEAIGDLLIELGYEKDYDW